MRVVRIDVLNAILHLDNILATCLRMVLYGKQCQLRVCRTISWPVLADQFHWDDPKSGSDNLRTCRIKSPKLSSSSHDFASCRVPVDMAWLASRTSSFLRTISSFKKAKLQQHMTRIRLAQQACSNMEDQFSAPAAGTEIECATNLSAWAWNLNSSLKEILRNAATHGNLRCPLDEATFLRGPWDPCYFKCLQACTTCLTPELDR